ncbi:hypothetical protein H4R33_006960, partial [Dimargaris cristalligena]
MGSDRPPTKYTGHGIEAFLEDFEQYAIANNFPERQYLNYVTKYVPKRLRNALLDMYTHRDSWADIRRYLLDSEDTKEYSTGTQRSRALRKLVRKKPKSKNLVSFLLQFAATANQTPMVSDEEKIDLLSSADEEDSGRDR